MKHRIMALATLAVLTACAESPIPTQPNAAVQTASLAPANAVEVPLSFVSGSVPVTTYNAISVPTTSNWETNVCTTVPAFPVNSPSWTNPHPAFVVNGHPWQGLFSANWINSWNSRYEGQAGGPPGYNWSKYTTTVSGNGTYVLQLLADNCSWVYIDSTLVGAQPAAWNSTNTKFPVTLSGTATLTFLVFDGGGQAGGMFRLETTSSYVGNGGDTTIISPPLVTAAPTTTTVSFGAGPFVYNGSAFTATASVSPATAGSPTITYAGDCTNAGTTCVATATYAGNASYLPSSASANITIDKLPTTASVTFGPGPFIYKGSAFTATAAVSPAAAGAATISYSGDCTNAGSSCVATATYAGNAGYLPSTSSANITISQAPTTTSVAFGSSSFTYTGSAFSATASVSPAAAGAATISYSGDCTNAGTCVATATFAASGNYLASSASASLTINKAPTSTSVTFGGPGPFIYTGSAFTATASVNPSAAGTAAISYAGDCVNAGSSCQATASYAGNGNYFSSSASTSIVIKLPVVSLGDQCKKDGWRFVTDDLGNLFKNQGDCVSYVATKGKNKGAGGTP